MDIKANGLLSKLQEQMRQESLVKGIEDLQVGDIVYYDMDRSDGIVPNEGYDSRLKYVVVAGSKTNNKEVCAVLINTDNDHSLAPAGKQSNILSDKQTIQASLTTTAGLIVLIPRS